MTRKVLDRHANLLISVLLIALTLAAFWPLFRCGFVGYDDEQYITDNARIQSGINAESLRWAFTSHYASNWHPLTWISHMVDWRLFGANPDGHHAVNLFFHAVNALLLYFVLRRMTRSPWKSAFVAALFAVHPMHVESVALAAERKDVLSTFFWLLTMWAYARYAERPRIGRYVPVVLFLGLGLLSKPAVVTLPIVLLLMDYWPLGRFHREKGKPSGARLGIVLEKLPLLAMSAASCVVTYVAQRAGGAMVQSFGHLTVGARMDNALVSYMAYIGKLFWPVKLAVFYPHPGLNIPEWRIAGSVVALACITIIALGLARPRPYLAVGWLWFLVTLVPIIGIIQVGQAAMADRYSYVSYIGLFIIIAWLAPSPRLSVSPSPIPPFSHSPILVVGAAVVICALTVGTWFQLRFWRNELTLFNRAVEVTKDNDFAHIHIGMYLGGHGRLDEAALHYKRALAINQSSDRAHNNLGNVYFRQGKLDAAMSEYQTALTLRPSNAIGHFNMAIALAKKGFSDQAADEYRTAIEIRPDYMEARINLADILSRQGKTDEVVECFSDGVDAFPNSADARNRLGMALSNAGRYDEAVEQYHEALRLEPRFPEAHYNLGNAFARQGKADDAIAEYRQALKQKPNYADAHFNLGVVLDGRGDTQAAMEEYRAAIKLNPKQGESHVNLAIDLYMNGDYAEAWKEVHLARKCGCTPNPDFVKALSSKMREPAR